MLIIILIVLFGSLLVSLLKEAENHVVEGRLLGLVPVVLGGNLLNLNLAPVDELLGNLGLLELGRDGFLLLFLHNLLCLLLNRLLNLLLLLFLLSLSLQCLFLLLGLRLLLLRFLLRFLLLLLLLTLLAFLAL